MPTRRSTVAPIHPLLTNVAVAYQNRAFISEIVMPVVNVGVEKFTYYRFHRDHFKRYNTKREIGSKFMRLDYDLETDTATCQEYGVEHPVDDRIRAEAQKPLDPDIQGTEICAEAIRLDYEKQTASLLTTAANYNSGMTSQPTIQWNASGATIFSDITNAQELVRQQIGQYPNVIVIPAQVAQVLAFSSEITSYITNVIGIKALGEGPDSAWMLPSTLFGMKVVVPGSIEVTSNLMQPTTTSDVWGDYCWLGYVNPKPALMRPSFGYTFRRRSFQTQVWRDEAIASDIIRVGWIQTKEIITVDEDDNAIAGYLYSNTLA